MPPALSIPFSSPAGTAESHWLRLVQVGADGNIATMDEAADLIDSLYNVSPCETGTEGTGGEAADDSNLPDEDTFLALSADKLGALCEDQDHWDVQVDLLRSHAMPAAWQARSDTATLIRTDIITEPKTETVTLDGANHYDLEYPYHSGLSVRGADVVDVRGSTVNFVRPVTGRVRISYTARIERLTFRVPATPDAHGQGRAEPAAVIVFWDRRAAQLDLRQPETDDGIDAAELARLCRGAGLAHGEVGGNCWQTIEHYRRCQCSDTEAPGTWDETVGVNCPKGISGGAQLGTIRRMDGYVGCPGERDEELSDPEYYRRVCCHYPPPGKSLPVCRKRYSIWRGGEPIEGGADRWRDIYGPNVSLVAVTPPEGCGKKIVEWEVNERRCCDDVIPLEPSPDNPTTIRPGGQYVIGAQDGTGKPGDLIWQLSGGLEFHDGTTYKEHGGRLEAVRARSAVCPNPRARLDDGCYPLDLVFEGDSENDFRLSAHDLEVGAGHTFVLTVSGGVPPYMWMATGDLYMIAISADGTAAQFRTRGRNEWCYGEVTVSDACGNDDRCGVRNALTGQWQRHQVSPSHEYYYNPPGAPYPVPSDFSPQSNATAQGTTDPHGPYKVSYYSRLVQKRVDRPYEPERCEMFSAQAAMYQAMCAAAGWRMEDGVCRQGSTYVRLMTCYALSWYEWLCYE